MKTISQKRNDVDLSGPKVSEGISELPGKKNAFSLPAPDPEVPEKKKKTTKKTTKKKVEKKEDKE